MKIAHITATFPPYHGGTGNVCYHNARELARLGHDVHVFTADHGTFSTKEYQLNVTIHRLSPIFQVGNAPILPGLLSKLHQFDVIHLHYPFIFGAEMCAFLAQWTHTPLVVSFHNDLIGDGVRKHLFTAYQKTSARLTVRQASQLCVVSTDHYEFSNLKQAVGDVPLPVTALPNGVDIEHFCPNGTASIREQYGIPIYVPIILFVAALDRAHHFKGLERMLQAMPHKAHLLVVGDGDLRQAYEQQAAELGIHKQVTFVGKIGHERLPEFYRAADVTVLPSSPPESFGLVLIESMACGTPVIASDIPGVRTVVDNGRSGFLTPHADIEALSTKLQVMLALPQSERHKLGLAGRQKVEKMYAWPQIGRQLESIYKRVLQKSTAAQQAKVIKA